MLDILCVHLLSSSNSMCIYMYTMLGFLCYDDGCHLKKFACNSKRKDSTTTSKWISSLDIVVDELHFRGHVDKWCHEHCNPNDFDELNKVHVCVWIFIKWDMGKYPSSKLITSLYMYMYRSTPRFASKCFHGCQSMQE